MTVCPWTSAPQVSNQNRNLSTPARVVFLTGRLLQHVTATSRSSTVLPRLGVSSRHVRAPSRSCGSRNSVVRSASASPPIVHRLMPE